MRFSPFIPCSQRGTLTLLDPQPKAIWGSSDSGFEKCNPASASSLAALEADPTPLIPDLRGGRVSTKSTSGTKSEPAAAHGHSESGPHGVKPSISRRPAPFTSQSSLLLPPSSESLQDQQPAAPPHQADSPGPGRGGQPHHQPEVQYLADLLLFAPVRYSHRPAERSAVPCTLPPSTTNRLLDAFLAIQALLGLGGTQPTSIR